MTAAQIREHHVRWAMTIGDMAERFIRDGNDTSVPHAKLLQRTIEFATESMALITGEEEVVWTLVNLSQPEDSVTRFFDWELHTDFARRCDYRFYRMATMLLMETNGEPYIGIEVDHG